MTIDELETKIAEGMTNEEALRLLDAPKYGAAIDAMREAEDELRRAEKKLAQTADAVLALFGVDNVVATLDYRMEEYDRASKYDEYDPDRRWESPERSCLLATWMLEEAADAGDLEAFIDDLEEEADSDLEVFIDNQEAAVGKTA